jgi:DNA polymerase-3 subunit epsilon
VAIDFESAGMARGETDVPVQIGLACMEGMEIQSGSLFRSHLACTRPIAWAAQKVHGITAADLAGAPPLLSLWPEVKRRFEGAVPVAHGSGTERRYLRAFPTLRPAAWVDTLQLARALDPGLASYQLGDLVSAWNLEGELQVLCPGFRWHDALCDAVASLAVLRRVIRAAGLEEKEAESLFHPDAGRYYRQLRPK